MKKTILAIGAAMAFAPPAFAQNTVEADTYRIDQAQLERDAATRKAAMRTEILYVVLAAADLAITVQCIEANECHEANPIAKGHSTGQMIAIKSALTLGHVLFVHRLAKNHPKAALRFAQVSVGLQGTVVGLNIRTRF